MHYFVGGINGVGKSTLLREAVTQMPQFEVIKGSRFLMEHLGFGGDYEKLRRHPQEDLRLAWGSYITQITQERTHDDLFFDAHYLNLIRGEVFDKTGPWLADMHGLILVEASAVQVEERIHADSATRERALFEQGVPREEYSSRLEAYASQTREKFMEIARRFNLPHCTVRHNDGETQKAVEQIIAFDARLRGR